MILIDPGHDFRVAISTLNISETTRDIAICYRKSIGSQMRSIEWWYFQWPWRTPNPVFKVTAYLKSNISKPMRLTDIGLVPIAHHISLHCFDAVDWVTGSACRTSNLDRCAKILPLLVSATADLFRKMQSPHHCIHTLLPPDRHLSNTLRTRGHDFELPKCSLYFINDIL